MKQVGGHDRLGMQMIPLKKINHGEKKVFNLDLIKNSSIVMDVPEKKQRGRLELDLSQRCRGKEEIYKSLCSCSLQRRKEENKDFEEDKRPEMERGVPVHTRRAATEREYTS
ncbi:Synaptotagmin-3 [Raphanus sativus]|nr:Synaptotagmin-3 [Raphanus sativus]